MLAAHEAEWPRQRGCLLAACEAEEPRQRGSKAACYLLRMRLRSRDQPQKSLLLVQVGCSGAT